MLFSIGPRASFTRTLIDEYVDPNAKMLEYNGLPDWYLKQAEQQEKMLRQLNEQLEQMQIQFQTPPRV